MRFTKIDHSKKDYRIEKPERKNFWFYVNYMRAYKIYAWYQFKHHREQENGTWQISSPFGGLGAELGLGLPFFIPNPPQQNKTKE